MIEEIKMILDAVDGVADLGLWALLAFVVFKLVIYMSTTGATVYCVKLVVEKLHDVITKHGERKLRESELAKQAVEWDMGGLPFNDAVRRRLESSLKAAHEHRSPNLTYMHDSDADWVGEAIREKIERERQS